MNKTFCDKCGQECMKIFSRTIANVYDIDVVIEYFVTKPSLPREKADICEDCSKSILKALMKEKE